LRSAEKHEKLTKALVAKEKKRRQKLAALGIDYDFPGYVHTPPTFLSVVFFLYSSHKHTQHTQHTPQAAAVAQTKAKAE
jgi:hypothetical protein